MTVGLGVAVSVGVGSSVSVCLGPALNNDRLCSK